MRLGLFKTNWALYIFQCKISRNYINQLLADYFNPFKFLDLRLLNTQIFICNLGDLEWVWVYMAESVTVTNTI